MTKTTLVRLYGSSVDVTDCRLPRSKSGIVAMATPPWRRLGFSIALLGVSVGAAAQQPDASPWVTATVGYGQRLAVYGIGALWHVPWGEEMLARRGLDARLGVDVLRWEGPAQGTADRFLWNGNLTPYLRWHPAEGVWHNTFIEVGVGVQLLSNSSITSTADYQRNFATALQFGERLAAGVSFGPRGRYEIATFLQHVSNAKIKKPNDGLTYFGLTVRLALDPQ